MFNPLFTNFCRLSLQYIPNPFIPLTLPPLPAFHAYSVLASYLHYLSEISSPSSSAKQAKEDTSLLPSNHDPSPSSPVPPRSYLPYISYFIYAVTLPFPSLNLACLFLLWLYLFLQGSRIAYPLSVASSSSPSSLHAFDLPPDLRRRAGTFALLVLLSALTRSFFYAAAAAEAVGREDWERWR